MAGTTILVDRYAYSGVAYTASKGYDWDWCLGPDKGLLAPDLVIYLFATSTILQKRGGYGEERYENETFQSRVSEIFEKLKTKKWLSVSSDRRVEEVTLDIISPMRNIITSCLRGSLEWGVLWEDG
jgi:dTMP kinase